MIPYGRQHIDEKDVEAVVEVLRSDFLTQGPLPPEFEKAMSNYCHAEHAVATNNATAALHLACLAHGVAKGDRVWTSALTFVSSATCALFCGADVEFVDIEPATGNMSVNALQQKLEQAEKDNTLPKLVIPVHFAGRVCDMEGISRLAGKYGFKIVEDAAHAIGSEYRGSKVGAGQHSSITVFSFHPVKVITSVEGGMALTNSEELATRMRKLGSHGIESKRDREQTWIYEMQELGYNYRMNDVQAALGLSQLDKLDSFIEKRGALARRYTELLEGSPLVLPGQDEQGRSAWHLYVVNLDRSRCGVERKDVFLGLRDAGIGVNVHYIPVYRQPYFVQRYGENLDCPAADAYYESALTLPLYPNMTEAEQDRVVMKLKELIE